MKKRQFWSAIAAVAVSVSSLTWAPIVPWTSQAAEVVYNDFEESYGGWYGNADNVVLTAEDGCGADLSRGMKVAGRTSPFDGASSAKGFYLSGDTEYDYSVKVYSTKAEKFHVTLTYADEKTGKETTAGLLTSDTKADTWTELRASFKAPENTCGYLLTITTDSTDDFSFDDVRITTDKPVNTAYAADEKGLKDEFASYFRVGNTLNNETVKDSKLTAMIMKEYNSITCGNQMKPDYLMVQSKSSGDNVGISLKSCASILDFCQANNIGLRGHTLVWHAQTPSWFFKKDFDNNGAWVDKSTMDKRLENYIKTVFEEIDRQYPKLDLYAYDVCNECVANTQDLIDNNKGIRQAGDHKVDNGSSAWVQIYGDNSYVEKAFTYAKKYAPDGCDLYYNDYNEYWDGKRDRIYDLCKPLYEKGVLDGIGMQSHISANKTGFGGTESYVKAMKKFLSIGCDVQITELDISLEKGKYTLQDQADKYEAIFRAAMDCNDFPQSNGRVKAICMWGLYDKLSWIGAENKPLLFDDNVKPKLAYERLTGMIHGSEWGEIVVPQTVEPDENGWYFHSTFEDGTDGWSARGSAEILVSGRKGFESPQSLLVRERTSSWHGASYALDTRAFLPGNEYSFSTNVTYFDGDDGDKFYLKLQYTDSEGKARYSTIAEGTGIKEQWVQLENTAYKIPDGASDMSIYVETADTANNFYIDETIGAVAGTVINGAGQPEIPTQQEMILGDIDGDRSITVFDMILAKQGLVDDFGSDGESKAADVDSSGKFEINDAVLLQKFLLGRIREFPAN